MKLRTKYILFVAILHLVTLALTYFIFRDNKLLFIASEALIIVSLVISWRLYGQLIQPLKMLLQGVDAIRDRDFNVKFLPTGKYEMDELIHVYNQMIDQLRVERTRQEQQHFFLEKLINTSPTGIIILDFEDRIQQINPRASLLLGMEEASLTGRSIHEITEPVMQQLKQLRSGDSKTITINGVVTYKLRMSHFVDRGFPRRFIMIEELTAEIIAAEKKAYGKVIRMMAHEVNNTVGPVNSIIGSVLNNTKLWDEAEHSSLRRALQVAVARNQNLNIFMRNFADVVRLPEPQKREVSLHKLVRSIGGLMELKAAEKRVTFSYALGENDFFIVADEQQMEQVLVNIVKNAVEAIEESGTVTFQTDLRQRRLLVIDTGRGLPPDAADQLFSPFFSRKKDGQGIGLTLVKEILVNHRFEFSLQTPAPGRTEFMIRFPG